MPYLVSPAPRLLVAGGGLLALAVLGACNDYDLVRPDDKNLGTEPDPTVPTEPDIQVEPASLDFGGVLKDCPSAPLSLTVRNVGDGYLDVTSLATGNSSYVIDWDGVAFQLAPGAERVFEVAFTPDAYATFESEVTVASNDPDEATVVVPAEGFGDANAMYEEGFTQESYASLDVLWVIDNSGSMSEEQQQVRDNFESFINEFVGLGLDYHLAVVATDMDAPMFQGKFVGDVITPASDDPVAQFLLAADLGSSGSGSERGMDAVKAALSEPLISGENAGFLREDAALAAIVLSDEDDSSTTGDSAFASWFMGLKADSSMVSFNAIVGDPTSTTDWLGGCTDWSGATMLQANAGDRYVDMANTTGGIWRSICYSDYDETLSHVSLTSAGMITTLPLSQTPTNWGLIEVYVDETQWLYSLFDGWTYDADENSITFHGEAIPGPGAYVRVAYPITGECE